MRIKPNTSGTHHGKQATVLQAIASAARRQRKHCGEPRGFTLLEVMIVMVIMAIMSAVAIPAFSSWREKQAVRNAAQALLAQLKQARVLAVSENRSVSITFTPTSYTFDADIAGSCSTCKNQTVNLSQFSKNLSITKKDPTKTPATKTFTSRGTVSSTTLYLCASGYSKRIKTNIIGHAYECKPGDTSASCTSAYNCQ